ncbi:E3 ubiquitin-protein ligase RNF14 [Boleophthalmus pectinirostris]|uniref:E3 ubiquitin-protein ligase RNF14 n=1 Tax=Boleophthalmus pectinirostris TaxID=150288 RepID=UPI000A1C4F36|nr:E3 ubiquitin-protein ligase RNF14 [Boleophthalmus pectinirostris]XP_020780704.1 E3 ubiquitin-protein ligase RNF14 [Boleophthalmus pectinirostris]
MSEDKEAQEDELLALASIYDEEEFRRAEGTQGGEVQMCVELPADFKVVTKGDKQTEYNVCFLPPLVLNFEFPEDYPSTSPPQYTLSSKWMTRAQMSALCRRLDELWEENQGCVILFTWIQFLKEETVDYLCIKSPLEVHRAKSSGERKKPEPEKREEKNGEVKKPSDPSSSASSMTSLDPRAVALLDPRMDLLPQLLDHDEAQRQRLFDGKVFCCGICFNEKLGAACLCFKECQHVYCNACMSEYFQIQIKDGNVQCLNCPEPKCSSVATPLQVKHLVGEELFARYDRLLLQSTLDLMADVVYCPRVSCGTPVMVEPESTMGICSGCQYAFCTLCKMGYHGVSHCKLPTEELRDLRDEYLAASEDGKKFMEMRFGKRVIQRAVEESFSRDWLSENCKNCPRCGTNIQKVDGCNKMTCTSCKQYFCWLCMGVLSRGNPYSHFNNPQSPCFNQLFLGVDQEDGDFDQDFFPDEFSSDEDD